VTSNGQDRFTDQEGAISDANVTAFQKAPSPIKLNVLKKWLQHYNQAEATILWSGFKYGFRLNYEGERKARFSKNLKSAVQYSSVVKQKIDKEIQTGRVAGPFDHVPIANLQISPIGIVPKKSPGDYRLIHHLSYPIGSSINDFIDPKICSVKYTEFDEAVFMIQDLGKNCWLFKMDIKSAFRLLPIHPCDFELLGFSFNEKYYFDKCAAFGCSISPKLFETFSTFLEHVIKARLPNKMLLHYLDDFLGGDISKEACSNNMRIFSETMLELGVPLANEKTEGPSHVLVFLGLELDSLEMVVRIPKEKMQEVVEKINAVICAEKVSLKTMQSLIGSLNFCCRAIVIGRPFCRRLINATCKVKLAHHRVRVTLEIKRDLKMWLDFFKHFNGVSVFHDRFWISNDDFQLYTDSSGGVGFGIWFNGHWCQEKWPADWVRRGLTKDITLLELFPIVVATVVYGDYMINKKVKFHCDNMAAVCVLNSMTSKSTKVLALLRVLTMQGIFNNCLIKAEHIDGYKNDVADALSRFQNERFQRLAQFADKQSTPMPAYLWNIFDVNMDSWYSQASQTKN